MMSASARRTKVNWNDDYATGIQYIDDQHKMLFQMAEDFRSALEVGEGEGVYSSLLDALKLYCRSHFGIEEKCMDEYHCPVAQVNKRDHEKFLKTLAGFQQRYAASGFSRTDAWELTDVMSKWLVNHIVHIDLQLKQYINK